MLPGGAETLIAARLADAAYGRYHRGLPRRVWEKSAGTEYLELRREGDILDVGCRGTDEKPLPWSKDWRRNLDFRLRPRWKENLANRYGEPITVSPGRQVHAGFDTAVQEIFPFLRTELKKYPADLPLRFYGHSHGGPMAGIIADILAHVYGREVLGVYTFGCPNWCTYEYALGQIDCPTWNFICGAWPLWRDPVPHYPHKMQRTGTDIILPGRFGALRNHVMGWYLVQAAECASAGQEAA